MIARGLGAVLMICTAGAISACGTVRPSDVRGHAGSIAESPEVGPPIGGAAHVSYAPSDCPPPADPKCPTSAIKKTD